MDKAQPSGRKVLSNGPVRRRPETTPRDDDEEHEEALEKETLVNKKAPEHETFRCRSPATNTAMPVASYSPWKDALYISLAFFVCLLATNVATFYHRERIALWLRVPENDATWPLDPEVAQQPGLVIEPVAYNSTTPAILYETRLNLAKHLLNVRGIYPCLCMHHMRVPDNVTRVRACGVLNDQQFYFMRNLRLIGYNKGAPVHDVLETCREHGLTTKKTHKRASQLYVEWDDDAGIMHYAQFRDATAFCLQRVLEEFEGKC
jgi:hypothetical protein